MSDSGNALFYRIKKDASLKKYLSNDFIGAKDTSSHLFSQVFSAEKKLWGEVIQLYINDVKPEVKELLTMYIQKVPVRDIAVKMNTTPRSVTVNLNKLKTKLMKRFKDDMKEDNLLNLTKLQDYSNQLDSLPQNIADKAYNIRFHNIEKTVYRVNRDGDTMWVNEYGVSYAKDVQEILDDLPELELEVLDVE
jgi:hypothetical protein